MKIILFWGLFLFYGVRIYLLIRQNEKKISRLVVKLNDKWESLLFLAIDIGGLCLLILQLTDMVVVPLPGKDTEIKTIGLVLFVLGTVFSGWSRIYLGKYWDTAGAGKIRKGHKLVTGGSFSFCRHPIYTGTFFLFLGFELALGSWLVLFSFPLILVIIRAAVREEKALERYFGRQYRFYRSRVPMFF